MARGVIALVVFGLISSSGAVLAQGQSGAGEGAQRERGELTRPPELLREVEAEYTEEALEAGIEGTVQLKIEIDAEGDVADVEVVDGLGHGLGEAAREAARQFEFRPAEIDGEPAAVVLPFRIRFSLPRRPATLRGRVFGGSAEEPVSGVSVELEYVGEEYEEPPSAETTTSEKGRFQFDSVPPGEYRLRLDAEEYGEREASLSLESNETLEVDYRLDREPVDIAGKIFEAGTREPLGGIRIRVLDFSGEERFRELYTEGDGSFAIRGLDPGEYRLRLDAEGYDRVDHVETVSEEVRLDVRYYLEAEYYDEYSVRTTARRESETTDRKTLRREEVRRIPGSGGDVVRSVQNLPGVARAPFAGGQLVVRGSTPESTDTFVEGAETPNLFHFFGGPSVISSEMIDSIDFYPGNYRAKYGRALAGIVDLQTREPRSDRYHGFAEVDLIDATAQLEGPISDDVSFAVSGRRSYVDAILPLVLTDDGPSFRVAPRYYDFQGWLSWEVDEENRLELFTYGSNDRIEALFDEDNPQGNSQVQITGLEFGNEFYRGQAAWEWRPTDARLENDAMVAVGQSRFGFEAARNLFFRLNATEVLVRDELRWEIHDAIQWNVGTDTQLARAGVEAEFPSLGETSSDPGSSRSGQAPNYGDRSVAVEELTDWVIQPAVYSEVEFEPVRDVTLIPGLRVDYFEGIGEFAESPRFNARWEITDAVAAKGGVGLFTQPPSPDQSSETFGNPELTFERATQYSVGSVLTPADYLEVDTTLFYRDLDDLITPTDEVRIDSATGSPEPVIYDNAGSGRAYGFEVLARHYPANKFFGWVAYTLSRSERRDPETGEWTVFEYDQTHIFSAVAGYNLPWNVDVSARFRLVTGNPETPVVGSVWNADQDSYSPIYGEPNSIRSDTFHQLDLRVDKEFVFNTWRLGVYLDVINAYNAKNEEGKRYNYDYSERGSVNGLPIIPTLGVNGRF